MAKKFVKTTTTKWGSMSNEQKSNYSDSIVFIQNDTPADSAIIGAVTKGTYILQGDSLIGGGIDINAVKSKSSIEIYLDSGSLGLDISGYFSASIGTVPSKTSTGGISWVQMPSGGSSGSETTIEYAGGSIDMKGGQIKQNGTVILDASGNLSSATASRVGGIKVSSVNSTAVTAQAETTTSGRYYKVELNSDKSAIVNVPWVNSLNCDYRTTTNTSAITSVELAPNIFRKFSNALAANLSITLDSSTASASTVNEYLFEFSFGSTLYTVSFPSTIKWADNKTPVFKANKTYQISIVNNLAVYLEF